MRTHDAHGAPRLLRGDVGARRLRALAAAALGRRASGGRVDRLPRWSRGRRRDRRGRLRLRARRGSACARASMYGLLLAVATPGQALGAVALNRVALTLVELIVLFVGGLSSCAASSNEPKRSNCRQARPMHVLIDIGALVARGVLHVLGHAVGPDPRLRDLRSGAGVRAAGGDAAGARPPRPAGDRPGDPLRRRVVVVLVRGVGDGQDPLPARRRLRQLDGLHVRLDEPRDRARDRDLGAARLAVRARRARRRRDHDRPLLAARRLRPEAA